MKILCRILGHAWSYPNVGMSGREYVWCYRCDKVHPER